MAALVSHDLVAIMSMRELIASKDQDDWCESLVLLMESVRWSRARLLAPR